MRGDTAEEVASKLLQSELLKGLQGPTVSPVYTEDASSPSGAKVGLYAAVACVHKKKKYPAVKEFRKLGGSGVLVQPMTYVFDEEPPRWVQLLENLGIDDPSSVQ